MLSFYGFSIFGAHLFRRILSHSNSFISGVFCYLGWTGLDLDNQLDWVGRLIWNFSKILKKSENQIFIFPECWLSGKYCNFFVFTNQKLKIKSWLVLVLIPSFPESLAMSRETRGYPTCCRESYIIYAERRYGQKPWVSTQETLKSLTNVELCTQSGLLGRAFVQGMAHPLNTCG